MPNTDSPRIELTFLPSVTEQEAEALLERWGKTYSGILDWSLPREGWSRKHRSQLEIDRDGEDANCRAVYCVVEVSKHAPMIWLLTQLQAQPQVDAGQTCELEKFWNPIPSPTTGEGSWSWAPKQ